LSESSTPYRIEVLRKNHSREAFACGYAELDRYLKQQARQDAEKRVAAPFVLVEPPAKRVLGYYTLSSCVVEADGLPPEIARKLPRYPQLPATLLGRLAVDQTMSGRGLGEFLLMDALHRSLTHSTEIAALAVLVDAKDSAAAAFYAHYGFIALEKQPLRLFLPMQTLTTLFP
jgi:GNAT superfamily N-acetyltransferase